MLNKTTVLFPKKQVALDCSRYVKLNSRRLLFYFDKEITDQETNFSKRWD